MALKIVARGRGVKDAADLVFPDIFRFNQFLSSIPS
jgi:hypothetical protein